MTILWQGEHAKAPIPEVLVLSFAGEMVGYSVCSLSPEHLLQEMDGEGVSCVDCRYVDCVLV